MKKISTTLRVIKGAAEILNYKHETRFGIMNMRHGGRGTTTLEIFHDPATGSVLLNISDACTFCFVSDEEFDEYIENHFAAVFDTEKDMYKAFTGMDDETWNAWNEEEV